MLFRLVDAGFRQRRKMLRRSLAGLADAEAFAAAGVRPQARAAELQGVRGGARAGARDAPAGGGHGPEAPSGRRATVHTSNNNGGVACSNGIGGTRPAETVVLHADAFLQIGDLTDAPVPVQVTW